VEATGRGASMPMDEVLDVAMSVSQP
jgi:hypothetical protein